LKGRSTETATTPRRGRRCSWSARTRSERAPRPPARPPGRCWGAARPCLSVFVRVVVRNKRCVRRQIIAVSDTKSPRVHSGDFCKSTHLTPRTEPRPRPCRAHECQLVVCPALALEGGTVEVSNGGTYPSTATYACEGGDPPTDGDLERTCQVDGTWSGAAPTECLLSVDGLTTAQYCGLTHYKVPGIVMPGASAEGNAQVYMDTCAKYGLQALECHNYQTPYPCALRCGDGDSCCNGGGPLNSMLGDSVSFCGAGGGSNRMYCGGHGDVQTQSMTIDMVCSRE
jgi:hypothetical protein